MSFNTSECSSNVLLEEFKELIKDKNLTQEEVANKIGYTRKALNRTINGQTSFVNFDMIVALCKELGIKTIVIE